MKLYERKEKDWLCEFDKYEYFCNFSKCVYVKKGRATLTVDEIIKLISTKHSSLKFREKLLANKDYIPVGRLGQTIDRDNEFYIHTQQLFTVPHNNTLFINYTGHCGAVAGALSEQNIPLIWNLDLSLAPKPIEEQRILCQIQDYAKAILNNNESNNTNLGLMLECPHGFYRTIDYDNLPSPNYLKSCGIKYVSFMVETPADVKIDDYSLITPKLKEYLSSFKFFDINVNYVPLDVKTTGPEQPPQKEHINPQNYTSNFYNTDLKNNELEP